jgi:autophagy-related protein 9
MLREYNELQETHDRRLQHASEAADQYLLHFTDPLTETIGRFVGFVSGSIVGVLLVLTLIDSNILLYIQLGEKTLVWHLALWSAILTVSRLFVSKKITLRSSNEDIHQDFRDLVKSMKWCKKEWQHRAHTEEVYRDVSSMFPPPLVLFCRELVATLLTPWTLYTRIYPKAEQISEFILQSTVSISSIGDVCYHSTLQIHEAKTEEEQIFLSLHRSVHKSVQYESSSSKESFSQFVEPEDKLRQSVLSFMKQYPEDLVAKDLEASFMPALSSSSRNVPPPSPPMSPIPSSYPLSLSFAESMMFQRPRKELRFSTFESILEESFNYED